MISYIMKSQHNSQQVDTNILQKEELVCFCKEKKCNSCTYKCMDCGNPVCEKCKFHYDTPENIEKISYK